MPTGLIDELLDKATAAIVGRRRFPESTYRLQFHAGFKFRDARRIIPYLHDLGVTDCYASPYLKARPGSMHGYDIVDHRVLNPEIGSPEQYEALVQVLHTHGMGQVLDIVPNHMGIVGNENAWWNDVLENGRSSPYAGYFDIDWDPVKPQLHDKVLLPVLGDPYGKVLESQQLTLRYEAGALAAYYFNHRFPIAPGSSLRVWRHRLEELEQTLGKDSPELMEYESILTAISHLPPRTETDPAKVEERQREKEVIRRRLATLVDACPPLREFIQQNLAFFNGKPDEPRSLDALDELLNDQAYRLSFWRVAADETNYRRFFDINELAALSMEKPDVFAATHALVLRLVREGKVTGLRIDHPDGLYDPRQYLERLQQHYVLGEVNNIVAAEPAYGDLDWKAVEGPVLDAIRQAAGQGSESPLWRPLYVVVEKILGGDEPLPEDWPVHGTTGYEFLNWLNGLFVDPGHAKALTRIYQRWSEIDPSFVELVYQKKFLTLQVALSSELHMLAHQVDRLSEKNRWSRDFTLNSLRHALREIIACFPVYRSYISADGIHPRDHLYVQTAVVRAKRRNPAISASIFDFIRDLLLLQHPHAVSAPLTEADRDEQVRFVGKFQQVTGPVMAKGLEDTAFYDYNRLVSLNEVGGDPGQFGITPAQFHRHNHERQARYPFSLSATSTHDTKRSEDVRARLNVLSELPQEWRRCLSRWSRLNRRYRIDLEGMIAPDLNDEYLLYQTLVGAWPLDDGVGEGHARFVERIQQYMQKAIHEAKIHTSWINPNPAYDDAVRLFIGRLLDAEGNRAFLDDFRAFQRRVSHHGMVNSLSQTLLKIASPGVPDIYQGTELWDFSLVDPDNRRPVDYELRRRLLADLKSGIAAAGGDLPGLARQMARSMADGRIKLYVTYRGLHCRKENPGLFSTGEYHAADPEGSHSDHVCGFIRRQQGHWAVAAVPRLAAGLLSGGGDLPLGAEVWHDTSLLLPGIESGRQCRNVFTGEVLTTAARNGQASLLMADVFANFPVALLMAQE
ncbi:MAG TPA: malto-oligosyltrehalose synthase [Gemmataceae bacterium]|nr:malto-oligosyltrehalose synthase [Gemmataceae bacterium]